MSAPVPARPLTPMQALSNRLRRIMLVIGLGLVAVVIGSIITGPLALKLAPRLSGAPPVVATVIGVVFGRFWLIGVLPAIGYALGRTLQLNPLGLAFGAALTGELFFFTIEAASVGLQPLFSNLALLAARVGTFALGVLLTLRATRAGERAALRAQAAAAKVSERTRSEYGDLLAEAHRLAERTAAAEAARGTAGSAAALSTDARSEPSPNPASDAKPGGTAS